MRPTPPVKSKADTMPPQDPAECLVGYVLLWFPLSSETFIFREVEALVSLGLPVHVYTMYGNSVRGCSNAMRAYSGSVSRMGARALWGVCRAFWRALRRDPAKVMRLMRRGLFRKMRNGEAAAENIWCFMAGFRLAELCLEHGITLINAAWANGPATAAWVASSMSGIPFVFAGRAGDIYPADGILAEKAADAVFVRTNNAANVDWLRSFCLPGQQGKVKLVYNGLTFTNASLSPRRKPAPPYRLLAVGRFARTKGFPQLFTAMARLRRENFPVRLTLIGDGSWKKRLLAILDRLRLRDSVDMPGFVPNDRLASYMQSHDLLVVPSVVHANGDRDGIPNVIMEACSLGLPVVATDVCGIGEVIRNGETGLLVPQRDTAALARAIREQLENPEQAWKMACNARTLIMRMFDTRSNSVALRDIYLEAARRASND